MYPVLRRSTSSPTRALIRRPSTPDPEEHDRQRHHRLAEREGRIGRQPALKGTRDSAKRACRAQRRCHDRLLEPPTSDGGSPITDYRIWYSTDGTAKLTVPAAARSLVVAGLTNGQQYSFKVRARNTIDPGTTTTASTSPAETTKSDLVVTEVGWSPIAPTDGDGVRFTALIRNIGSDPSPNAVHHVQFYVDNEQVVSNSLSDPLQPGEERLVFADTNGNPSNPGSWVAKVGDHSVGAMVDSATVIPESDESNDLTVDTLTVAANDKLNVRIATGPRLRSWSGRTAATEHRTSTQLGSMQRVRSSIRMALRSRLPRVTRCRQRSPGIRRPRSSSSPGLTRAQPAQAASELGASTATGGPLLSEFTVNDAPVGDESYPSARAGGSNWLVVWQDARSGNGTDIYGQRVTAGGVAGTNFAVSSANRDERRPSVASSDAGWMVVWSDRRAVTSSDIYGARVALAGTVLDGGASGGKPIAAAKFDQSNPSHRLEWQQLPGRVVRLPLRYVIGRVRSPAEQDGRDSHPGPDLACNLIEG